MFKPSDGWRKGWNEEGVDRTRRKGVSASKGNFIAFVYHKNSYYDALNYTYCTLLYKPFSQS